MLPEGNRARQAFNFATNKFSRLRAFLDRLGCLGGRRNLGDVGGLGAVHGGGGLGRLPRDTIVKSLRVKNRNRLDWKMMALASSAADTEGEWYDVEESTSATNVSLLENALHMFDLDGSGQISREELRDVLRSLGQNPSEEELTLLFAQVDLDGDGTLDMGELVAFMSRQFCVRDAAGDLAPVFRLLQSGIGDDRVPGSRVKKMIRSYSLDENEEGALLGAQLLGAFRDDAEYDFPTFLAAISGTEGQVGRQMTSKL